jgi:hypothetical protein
MIAAIRIRGKRIKTNVKWNRPTCRALSDDREAQMIRWGGQGSVLFLLNLKTKRKMRNELLKLAWGLFWKLLEINLEGLTRHPWQKPWLGFYFPFNGLSVRIASGFSVLNFYSKSRLWFFPGLLLIELTVYTSNTVSVEFTEFKINIIHCIQWWSIKRRQTNERNILWMEP